MSSSLFFVQLCFMMVRPLILFSTGLQLFFCKALRTPLLIMAIFSFKALLCSVSLKLFTSVSAWLAWPTIYNYSGTSRSHEFKHKVQKEVLDMWYSITTAESHTAPSPVTVQTYKRTNSNMTQEPTMSINNASLIKRFLILQLNSTFGSCCRLLFNNVFNSGSIIAI